jgi:hypothetical protein
LFTKFSSFHLSFLSQDTPPQRSIEKSGCAFASQGGEILTEKKNGILALLILGMIYICWRSLNYYIINISDYWIFIFIP